MCFENKNIQSIFWRSMASAEPNKP